MLLLLLQTKISPLKNIHIRTIRDSHHSSDYDNTVDGEAITLIN